MSERDYETEASILLKELELLGWTGSGDVEFKESTWLFSTMGGFYWGVRIGGRYAGEPVPIYTTALEALSKYLRRCDETAT